MIMQGDIYKSKITNIKYRVGMVDGDWLQFHPISDDPEETGFIWTHKDDVDAQFVVVQK